MNELPEQMLPLFTISVGVVLTVILLTAVFELKQPRELVPVTLTETLTEGVITEDPLE